MNTKKIKCFKTKKYLYDWGTIYDPETEEKLNIKANTVFCKTSWVWILTYQESKESQIEAVRFLFVD